MTIRTAACAAALALATVASVAPAAEAREADPVALAQPVAGSEARLGPGADERFIGAVVRDVAARPASAAELTWWGTYLDGGGSRRSVVEAATRTPDGSRRIVATIYGEALDREPDEPGLAFWADRIARGGAVSDVVTRLYGSDEVRALAGGTTEAHVDLLYAELLGRAADPAGRAYWVGRLDAPGGRLSSVRALVRSVEASAHRVDDIFADLLHRAPDAGGRAHWAGVAARQDDLVVVAAVGASAEYGALAVRGEPAPAGSTPWVVSSPEAHGMDAGVLDGTRSYAFTAGRNTQGVVVVRGGEIVGEWYAPAHSEDSWAASWSVGKSFTSALIGIAIEEGHISSIDAPMTTWFPEWTGTPKAAITLRDVLEMASGLRWNESYNPGSAATSDVIQMVAVARDQLAYASSRPYEVAPGTRWQYSSGDSMILAGVVERATGRSMTDYAREKLFDPIGMERAEMWRDSEGNTLGYCCMDTTSRGFARFGQLYLQGGEWDGEQVVPADWVDLSVQGAPTSPDWYGLQWWLSEIDGHAMFSANGHDGQYIYVIPDLDLVVVRNGTYVKSAGEPIALPNLFVRYPSDGLVAGQGTIGPSSWDAEAFLGPILDSIQP